MTALLLLAACVGLETVQKPGTDTPSGTTTSVGSLQVDATEVAFGSVQVGRTADDALTLSNTGSGAIGVTLAVDGDGFEVSSESVSVATDQVVTLTFAPRTEGPYDGSLNVTVDSGDTLSIPLSGTGVAEGTDTDDTGGGSTTHGGGGRISVTPTHYDFGRVDTDTTTTATFTVSNVGDDDLFISDVTSSDRAWTTGGTLAPPQVLSPGSNKLLEVSFTPTAETAYSGSITVVSDDAATPELDIAVEGTGVDLCDICSPLIEVDTGGSSDTAITDFLSLFGSSDSRTITVRNAGDMDLVVDDVVVNNDTLATCGTFTLSGWGGSETVAPGSRTTFNIAYRSTDSCLEVAQSAFDMNVAHILSNDPTNGDWVIELSGAGL